MPTSQNYQRTGIHFAAYSEEQFAPIVITITKVDGLYCFRIDGPDNLAHKSEGRFEIAGDRSECEAATKALKSLRSGRTWWLRAEMFAERARATARGEFSNDSPPPKLAITIKTTSPTFAQLGELFSAYPRVPTKGGRLIMSMRALHTQLQRFDARWELMEDASPAADID
jgi:hypothetical protein